MKAAKRLRILLPSSADEEKNAAAPTLCILSLGLMAMGIVSLVDEWIHGWTGAATTLGVENLCLLAALWFNRRGEIERATRIICFSELACGLVLICKFGVGFSDEAMLLFPLILVTAAVLLDWPSYLRFAGLLFISVACAGFILAGISAETRLHTVINVVNILLVTVVAIGLLARNLKRSVSQSRQTEREVKALSARLIEAQEEERSRLACELHDHLSQQIAVLSIGMSNLKKQIPDQQTEAREQSDHIQQKLVEAAQSIRSMSHALHPAILQHSGLASALRTYCSEFGSLTGVRVSLHANGSFESVPFPAALCLYRIAQEALQNVAKHAGVSEAEVDLTRSNGSLCLAISDRGAGIQRERTSPPAGLGLISIKERTRLVHGVFKLESKPNHGTTLRVTIPA